NAGPDVHGDRQGRLRPGGGAGRARGGRPRLRAGPPAHPDCRPVQRSQRHLLRRGLQDQQAGQARTLQRRLEEDLRNERHPRAGQGHYHEI
ncbi:MAG: hypothetical protein AVDCRST_MAG56-3101, partial [uncultured Cytophagales bacterium]